MPNCILDGGYTLIGDCKENNHGGVQELYLGTWDSTDSYTINASNSAVTSITLVNTLYKYEQPNEIGEFIQEGEHNVENGTRFWTQTVNFTLHQMSAITRNTLVKLSDTDLICIVKDNEDNYWICGRQNGMSVTSSSASLNKSFNDLNGITVTLQGFEPLPADLLTKTAFDTLTVV